MPEKCWLTLISNKIWLHLHPENEIIYKYTYFQNIINKNYKQKPNLE